VQQYIVLPWTAALARFCVALVTLFDGNAAAYGKVLWNPSNGFGVSIEPGCNGIEAMIVLFAGSSPIRRAGAIARWASRSASSPSRR